jgi:hypothetical protein
MNIRLHIEQLILDGIGLDLDQASQVQAAVEVQLTRLLGEQSLPPLTAGAVPRLAGGDIAFTQADHPVHIGYQIARAVFSSLTPHAERPGSAGPPQ